MKVGLNATCFNNRPSGAKQRFIGIYSELIKRMSDTEFLIYEPSDSNFGSWLKTEANVSFKSTPISSQGQMKKFLVGLGYWKSTLQREGFDLFEGYNLPFFIAPNAKTIMTIHDVRGFHLGYSSLQKSFFKKILLQSLKKVDHVIAVSQTIKEEILAYSPESKVSVVNNGIDIKLFEQLTDNDLSSFKQKFNLPQKFILSVGHFEKRKNYLKLIDAFNKLHKRGLDYSMILIGSDNGQKNEIEDKIESLKLSDYIKILIGLNDFEVRCAYKLTSLFVFPSTYEGFGIPILESMASDCPFILSDIPVFKEITENKCIYFNPDEHESIALEIENVLTNSVVRERLINYGKQRVRDFSFHELASQLEYLYKLVMK